MTRRGTCLAILAVCNLAILQPAAAQQQPLVLPFRIDVSDEVLTDLRRRLALTRFPGEIAGAGWDYGTELGYLKELVAYWRDGFD